MSCRRDGRSGCVSAVLCKVDGPGGAVQMAYKAPGSPGFGSHGAICFNPGASVPAGETSGSKATGARATNPAPVAKRQGLAQTTR